MKTYNRSLMAGCSAISLAFGCLGNASAQSTMQTTGAIQLDTVVVTARKKSESLLSVPVAVSVLTSNDIESRGLVTINDITNFTPGLAIDQMTANTARTDRSLETLIIRGMNPASTNNPTTSIFINGVPVSSADFLQTIDDVDHVEVLKGPQSAYFGRETFAGAVNVITKAPSNHFTSTVTAEYGSRDTRLFQGTVSGPIIADKLLIEAGLHYDSHDGSYKNAMVPGQTLGDQTSKSAHVALTAHPIDNLTIKAFGEIFQDDDGPGATGILIGSSFFGPPAQFAQSNCTLPGGVTYFCGTLPGLNTSVSPAANTIGIPGYDGYIAANPGIIKSGDTVKGFGLLRNAYHVDLNIDYNIPSLGLTLSSLSGFNYNAWSEVSDLSILDSNANGNAPGYSGFPFLVENVSHDASQEFRLATDQTKPLRGVVGVSYVSTFNQQSTGVVPYNNTPTNPTESKTSGIFFGLSYDVLPNATINVDGRYQVDDEVALNINGSTQAEAKYYNFVPRVSLQYKLTPNQMFYVTYSEGVNPGTFNSYIANLPVVTQNALVAALGSAAVVVKPENLTNYEVGFKGSFFDRRLTLVADIYYDIWTNQLTSLSYTFAANDPTNPYNVQYLSGTTLNPIYHAANSAYPAAVVNNSSESIARGIEFDAKWLATENLVVNASAALNDTRFSKHICSDCLPYNGEFGPGAGVFDAKGEQLPNSPKYSANVGAQYSNKVGFGTAADWYVRGDFVYRSGVYIQADNIARTQDIDLVNVRLGINVDKVNVEGFVDNLFNNKSFIGGLQDYYFPNFSANAIFVGLPQLITGGVKMKYKF